VGLSQYVTSGCDSLEGQVTKLGEVIDIMWSSTMDESLTST
jgi:hypothetical protein